MYRQQVRRRRTVLVGLVIACLVLISTSVTESSNGPLSSIQRGISGVFGPVESGAERAFKPFRDLIGWFDSTFEAKGENEQLTADLQDARKRLSDQEKAIGENKQLRKLLKLSKSDGVQGYKQVAARVTVRNPILWFGTVTINQGSGEGVEPDDPVLGPGGLVGSVEEVTATSSIVRLITDQNSAVAAKVLPNGPTGLVIPEIGRAGEVLLDNIENDQKVKQRAILVTAGFATSSVRSNYPPGIPIGEVRQATLGEQETFQRVRIDPFVDLREFTNAIVLTGGGGG